MVKKHYTGVTHQNESVREKRHKEIAREAAANGIVLLKNEGVLPLRLEKVALYGVGACHLIKGGTGSGDVNVRKCVNVKEGLENAGIIVSSTTWLKDYDQEYIESRQAYKEHLIELGTRKNIGIGGAYFEDAKFCPSPGRQITMEDVKESDTDTAIYVLSRTSGEGADRKLEPGDYYMAEREKEHLRFLSANYPKVILCINTGGVVDLSILDEVSMDAVMLIGQPGMEGGNAVADVLLGKVVPSGKLTATWAKAYDDYPNARNFSHLNGNVIEEKYEEGRFVGYRYFDSYSVEPRYPFGFGLSYTTFSYRAIKVTKEINRIKATVSVQNTGKEFAGREVLQLYVSSPQTGFQKEEKSLVAFHKTKLLQPGEQEEIVIDFDLTVLATYQTAKAAYILESGTYYLLLGNHSGNVSAVCKIVVSNDTLVRQCVNICELHTSLPEYRLTKEQLAKIEEKRNSYASACVMDEILFEPDDAAKLPTPSKNDEEFDEQVEALVARFTKEEMAELVCGAQERNSDSVAGIAASSVPGAAGETTQNLYEKYGLPSIVLADGPAGIRIADHYQVNPANGEIYPVDFFDTVEDGFFLSHTYEKDAIDYYQYLTAIPVATMLAQTFDEELLYRVGNLIGEECREFEVTLWLAPGMNIQRNPLCGRNFEYYSEDPFVSGMIASFVTKGVQSVKGVGVTVKHFACNNQEDNRRGSNSIISERTLREIYLRGFEIVVTCAEPMSVMTSYNLVNGIHSANSHDLCTKVLRDEWGFEGMVMTDWTTTNRDGGSSAAKCIWAGNDCIMPGSMNDPLEILGALDGTNEQTLELSALQLSAKRIVKTILQSNRR